jgi:hypothetical protein
MTSSEQARIEIVAPNYLKNLVIILTEMGLRPFKELLPMKKLQVDLDNSVVSLSDSKTPSGIGDMPMTVRHDGAERRPRCRSGQLKAALLRKT